MTTVRMGTVWDRTVDVLQGRTAILAGLAALYVLLPNAVSGLASAWAQSDMALKPVAVVISFINFALLVTGVLAITAIATDPTVDRRRATGAALARFGAAIGVIVVVLLVVALVFVPAGVLLGMAGVRMTAAGQPDFARANGGLLALGSLYSLAALVLGLIVSAKLAPLLAVIVNERRGLGAVARAWQLTRGSTARLVGVILLYAVLLLVAMAAVSSVAGVIARLLLGADADVTVGAIVGIASAVVTALATVVQTVFYAQFYVAAAGGQTGSSGTAPPVA